MESNLAEEWKKVGFGWTNQSKNHLITSSTRVSFLIDPQIIHFNNFYEEFPNKSFHDYLFEQFTIFPFHDYHKFQQVIQHFLQQYFTVEKPQFISHYNDFLHHEGRSNERQLRWDIMHIPANLSFNLHAHPNIEIIWVLSGTIHEYRLVNNTNPTDFVHQYIAEREDKTSPSIKGPNLANVSDLQFVYNSVSAIPQTELTSEISMERLRSAFIINEIGSIHLSFTRDEETTLLVVWSGGHANVPKDEYPSHAKDLFPLVTRDDPY